MILPSSSLGVPLHRIESDVLTCQEIESQLETLVEFSIDLLDMIAWTLSELLDHLAEVSCLLV